MKMTDKDREGLKDILTEDAAMHLSHEFEDEDDFEEKFGPINTLEDAAELYVEHSVREDIIRIYKEWVEDFPENREELVDLFGLSEDDTDIECEEACDCDCETIRAIVYDLLCPAIGRDYAKTLTETFSLDEDEEDEDGDCYKYNSFIRDITEDVRSASAWELEGYYNSDDVMFAIGRVLIERLDLYV